MKKSIFIITLSIFNFLHPAFAQDDCFDNISKHVLIDADWGTKLDIANCKLNKNEMPRVMSYLEAHPEITTLDVGYKEFGTNEIKSIANIKSLTGLVLMTTDFGNADVIALSKNKNLKMLFLDGTDDISDKGVIALAGMPLRVLKLYESSVTDDGIIALAKSKSLESLDLADGDQSGAIGDKAAFAIAKSKLKEFGCEGCSFSNAGVTALAKNNTIKKLALVNNDGKINDIGASAFSNNNTLESLTIVYSEIRDNGAAAIARMKSLRVLNLSFNTGISDAGIDAIAKMKSLRELDLSQNSIVDSGVSAFVTNKTLKKLNLDFNNIGDAGAIVLAKNTTLEELSINSNYIGEAGIAALHANPYFKHLDANDNPRSVEEE